MKKINDWVNFSGIREYWRRVLCNEMNGDEGFEFEYWVSLLLSFIMIIMLG